MALTFNLGPHVLIGQLPALNGNPPPDYNYDLGPSLAWGGMGFLDPRFPVNQQNQSGQTAAIGWAGGYIDNLDAIPSASSVMNIAASAVPVAGTPLTLASSATSAVTKLATSVVGLASKLSIPAGTLVLDTQPGTFAVTGTNSSIQIYSPASNIARAVRVVSAGNDGSAAFTVAGYDIYGYPMTERLTGTSASTVNGKKAFKFISTIVPSGTLSGSNISVGTQDVFGFGLRTSNFVLAQIYWNSALITATTGFTIADATSPATSVTGDVRGTYAVQSAADGVKKLTVMTMVTAFAATQGASGLTGQTQV